jgi:hypothetical protein
LPHPDRRQEYLQFDVKGVPHYVAMENLAVARPLKLDPMTVLRAE